LCLFFCFCFGIEQGALGQLLFFEKHNATRSLLHLFRLQGGLGGLHRLVKHVLRDQLVLEARLLAHPAQLQLKILVLGIVVHLVDAAYK